MEKDKLEYINKDLYILLEQIALINEKAEALPESADKFLVKMAIKSAYDQVKSMIIYIECN